MKRAIKKTAICILLLCGLCFVAFGSPLPTNLVNNSSFENTGGWGSWTYSGSAKFNTRDNRESLFGNYSGSIENCTGEVILQPTRISIDPSKDYVVSGWIKTNFRTVNTAAKIRLLWYSATGFIEGQEYGAIQGQSDWTFVNFNIPSRVIPPNAVEVIVACLVKNGSASETGIAYFDGICFSQVSQLVRPQTPELNSNYAHGVTRISWDSQPGILEYFIYEGNTLDFEVNDIFNYRTSDTQLTFTNYEQKKKCYRIMAVNQNYVPSMLSNAVKGDTNSPSTVSDLAIDDSESGVVILTWTVPAVAPDGDLPNEYRIFRLSQPSFSETNIVDEVVLTEQDPEFKKVAGSTIEYWFMAPGNVEYYYTVVAVDDADNASQPSPIVSGKPSSDLVPPNGPGQPEAFVDLDDQGNQLPHGVVLLTWSAPTAAQDGDTPRYYLILRSVGDSQNMKQLSKIRAAELEVEGTPYEWRDVTATAGNTYYYSIVSVDKAGNRSKNDPVLAVNPKKPSAAQLTTPANGTYIYLHEEQIQLAWEPVQPFADAVINYTVQFSRSDSFHASVIDFATLEETQFLLLLGELGTGIWYWRIKTQFESGVVSYSQVHKLAIVDLEASESQKGAIAYVNVSKNVLSQGEKTTLSIATTTPTRLWVNIFNSKGKRVRSLLEAETFVVNQECNIDWDGKDFSGRQVANGLYFIQIIARSENKPAMTITKRVQVVNN